MSANQVSAGQIQAGEPGPGYDPGWTAATWTGAQPEPVPPKTRLDKARGGVRCLAFVFGTLLLLPIFFAVRATGGARDRSIAGLWCGLGAYVLGLRIRRVGAPMRAGGALLVNHSSWLDICVIGATAPVHFVSKAEVSGWPLFGWIGRISNTVFIARKRSAAREQERLLAARAAQGHLLCLFPEGTSTDNQRVLPFKSALMRAFMADPNAGRAATPVQPVSICYQPRPGLPRSFYGWWGRMGLFGHLWDVACLGRRGDVTIVFHPPLDPATAADRKALAQEARDQVEAGRVAARDGAI